MATNRWLAHAARTRETDTVVIGGTWSVSDTITVTCDSIDVVYTIGTGGTAVNDVAAGLKATLAGETPTYGTASVDASLIPQFDMLTYSVATDTVTATGPTDGGPFVISVAKSSASGTATHNANVTTGTGPNHWDNADNWSQGTVPADTEDLILEGTAGDQDIRYGLGASTITPASITIRGTLRIGRPVINTDGSEPFREYRDTDLRIGDPADATTIALQVGDSSTQTGSQRINIDFGGCPYDARVYRSGGREHILYAPVSILGTHATGNTLRCYRGDCEVGRDGASSVLGKLEVGYIASPSSDSLVTLGSGVTYSSSTTITGSGGKIVADGAGTNTTVNLLGCELEVLEGAYAWPLIYVGKNAQTQVAGLVTYNSSGTLTDLHLLPDGVAVFEEEGVAKTITNVYPHKNSVYRDVFNSVTETNGFDPVGCDVGEFTVYKGLNRTVSYS